MTTSLNLKNMKISDKITSFIEFLNKSPTAYHACDSVVAKLNSSNFLEVLTNKAWNIRPGGKYFLQLNRSAVIAFAIGGKYMSGNGISIIGSHTDSPHFRVKPNHDITKCGYQMVGVSTYGGGIWHTWFDRDLTIAGMVMVKNDIGGVSSKLVHLAQPLLRIPSLAIHLDRNVNDAFSPNLENQTIPIISLTHGAKYETSFLKKIVSETIGEKVENIVDMDLSLADTQLSCLGGYKDEFIFSGRLDNLFNVYCSTEGLIDSLENEGLKEEENIRMIICYDNEEVGSQSYQGAESGAVHDILKKIVSSLGADYTSTIANSFVLSADQAHAVHPNYTEKHELNHQVGLNNGIVIKLNHNQRYATTTFTSALVKLVSERSSIPYQNFCVKNDIPCGTTIGPIISALLGVRVADVGFPMLSMHSIREMCTSISVEQAITFYATYFKELPKILNNSS